MDDLRKAIDGWWVSPEADIRGRWAIRRSGKVVEYATSSDDAYERMQELRWEAVRAALFATAPFAWAEESDDGSMQFYPACALTEYPPKAFPLYTLEERVAKWDRGFHDAHCDQGEYEGSCKYGDDDCPTLREPIPANIYFDAEWNTFWRQDNRKSLTDVTNEYWPRFVDRRDEFPPLPEKWKS